MEKESLESYRLGEIWECQRSDVQIKGFIWVFIHEKGEVTVGSTPDIVHTVIPIK